MALNDDLKTLLASLKDAETNPKLNDVEIGTVEQVREALSDLITAAQEATK